MRTEPRVFLVGLLALGALCVGCPGTLEDKESFLAYAAQHAGAAGAAGAAVNGGSAGSAASAASAGSSAAGAEAEPAHPDPNGCGDVPTRIFASTCGGTGCHGSTASQQGLDLVSPGVSARLVGVPGTTCLQTLVDPQNPEESLLYRKLLPLPACGAQMPLARPPLGSADLACVLAWISAQK